MRRDNVVYMIKSILYMPMFAAIVAGMELLGITLFILCGICDMQMLGNDRQMSYLILLITQMFAFCVVQIIFYFQKSWDNHEAVWKSRVRFLCACLGCFIGMLLMIVLIVDFGELSAVQLGVWMCLSGLNFVSYIFYFVLKEKSRLETESRVYEKQSVLYKEWYEGFSQTRKETLAFRHDMNNHLGILKYLCKNDAEGKESNGRLCEIDKYIDSLGIQFNRTGCDTDSGNMMVDFAVDMKKSYAQTRGIAMETELHIPKEMNYSSMDLVIFLSNLLDNAIEACEKLEQREKAKIILKMQYKMSNLVVLIKNTYDGHLDGSIGRQKEYAMLRTSKEDKEAHGIGMKNVMDIVEKYNGVIQWEAEEGWFTVNALLYEFDGKGVKG